MLLRFISQAIGSLIILFYISWKLTLLMLGIVPFLSIGITFYGRKLREYGKEYQAKLAESSEIAQESFSNIRIVRTFATGNI